MSWVLLLRSFPLLVLSSPQNFRELPGPSHHNRITLSQQPASNPQQPPATPSNPKKHSLLRACSKFPGDGRMMVMVYGDHLIVMMIDDDDADRWNEY